MILANTSSVKGCFLTTVQDQYTVRPDNIALHISVLFIISVT